jgi:hypothetical protein
MIELCVGGAWMIAAHLIYKQKNRGGKSTDAKEDNAQFTWLCECTLGLQTQESRWKEF